MSPLVTVHDMGKVRSHTTKAVAGLSRDPEAKQFAAVAIDSVLSSTPGAGANKV